ncbi:unnamed protein product, partial [Haemonchus placei]|uniref:MFS domain-containing protein n=1 Tax=Haemonchus placei TaxID=6290 RepID=A0A0N4WIS9_HAEPC
GVIRVGVFFPTIAKESLDWTAFFSGGVIRVVIVFPTVAARKIAADPTSYQESVVENSATPNRSLHTTLYMKLDKTAKLSDSVEGWSKQFATNHFLCGRSKRCVFWSSELRYPEIVQPAFL